MGECALHIPQTQFDLAWQIIHLDEKGVSVSRVIQVSCEYFGMTKRHLLSHRRDAPTAKRRDIAMSLCRELTAKSFPQIGEAFDRDHSSIVRGSKRGDILIASNKFFEIAAEEIKQRVLGGG